MSYLDRAIRCSCGAVNYDAQAAEVHARWCASLDVERQRNGAGAVRATPALQGFMPSAGAARTHPEPREARSPVKPEQGLNTNPALRHATPRVEAVMPSDFGWGTRKSNRENGAGSTPGAGVPSSGICRIDLDPCDPAACRAFGSRCRGPLPVDPLAACECSPADRLAARSALACPVHDPTVVRAAAVEAARRDSERRRAKVKATLAPVTGAQVPVALLDALAAAVAFGCTRFVAERLRQLGADAARCSGEVLDVIRDHEDRLADEEARHA